MVVSGPATGYAPEEQEVRAVRAAVAAHVLIGSGITPSNIRQMAQHADALIVGSSAKFDGLWSNEVDPERVLRLIDGLAAAV